MPGSDRPSGASRSSSVSSTRVASSRRGSAMPPQHDGSHDERERSRSRSASRTRQTGSHAGEQSQAQSVPALRSSGQLLPTAPKHLDLSSAGWYAYRNIEVPTDLPPRGRPSTQGQPIKLALNTFRARVDLPKGTVYQYEVLVGNGAEKKGLIKRIWSSKTVQSQLGKGFLFDGERIAWSLESMSREVRILIDLDKEYGKTPRQGKPPNEHRIVIRQTTPIRTTDLMAYLEGRTSFSSRVLEGINFLDHLLRETPSAKYTAIKRNFFQRGEQRFSLGNGVEAFKGVYQSMRIAHAGFHNQKPLACLTVNLDVANGMFWSQGRLIHTAMALTGARDESDLTAMLKRDGEKGRGVALKKLRKLHVIATHRKGQKDAYVIEKLIWRGAKDYTLELNNDKNDDKKDYKKNDKKMSLAQYYETRYNWRIKFPDLPLVKMTKGTNTVLPMELLSIEQNERYGFKLDERQTSNMIKFAVEPPPQRWQAIEHGLRMLDWADDPLLKHYGVQISREKTLVDARLLPAPIVKYGAGEAKPGTSGRWDLKGKKFLAPNSAPLKSWGVCVIPGRRGGKPDKAVVENFIKQFVQIYIGHGGKVENKTPAMTLAQGDDTGAWVTATWNSAGNQVGARPQILVFILPDKDANVYGRIKRSAECRYGVVSQCMQYAHVQKGQAQYISNVCMKFNAKLGGITCRAVGPKSGGLTGAFTAPTMIIGGDVSHASPGAQTPSMAALTVSMDKLATRYAAICQTNGFRVEMIMSDTIRDDLGPLVKAWMHNLNSGKVPSRVLYFRDGVSEGQHQHVLQQEVHDMKRMLQTLGGGTETKFVVIIGSKRHHIRFFPEKGDRNGNALPGTLVETGATHPFENDFYLCGHVALKGTARPMHYHVLLNEANMSTEELQTLIYEHGYQFARSTTPVSQFPAIYYAHIASNRAIPHDKKWSGAPGSNEGGYTTASGSGQPMEFDRLIEMPNEGKIRTSMWYI